MIIGLEPENMSCKKKFKESELYTTEKKVNMHTWSTAGCYWKPTVAVNHVHHIKNKNATLTNLSMPCLLSPFLFISLPMSNVSFTLPNLFPQF